MSPKSLNFSEKIFQFYQTPNFKDKSISIYMEVHKGLETCQNLVFINNNSDAFFPSNIYAIVMKKKEEKS